MDCEDLECEWLMDYDGRWTFYIFLIRIIIRFNFFWST